LAAIFTNSAVRQEILQDALFSAWRSLPAFEGRAQFGNWMYRVTTNAALMHLRSRGRHPEIALGDIEPAALNDAFDMHGPTLGAGADWSRRPDEKFQSRELRHHLQHAVDALPEGLRMVFLLREVDGLSTENTAKVLGLTVAAAKTRLHRARAALREAVSDYVVA
jgi:RNA polymerase sigma-70 factor (ECF subfamily)